MAKTGADGARGNSAEETVLLTQLLATKGKAQHDRLWAEFAHRYERLIVSCVVKALRRYGATFSRDDLDDLVGDVWLVLLREDMKKLRQYDATRGFRIASFLGLLATNATIDHLRARQAEATPLDDVIEDYASMRAEAPRDTVEAREEAEQARAVGHEAGELDVAEIGIDRRRRQRLGFVAAAQHHQLGPRRQRRLREHDRVAARRHAHRRRPHHRVGAVLDLGEAHAGLALF